MSNDCIFCRIVKEKIPCHKVYEDDKFLGFLDINPFNPGHSLLIPKRHFRWVWQVSRPGHYWQAAHKIAMAQMAVLKPVTVLFLTSGFEIEHAHIHLVPRFENDGHGGFINSGAKKKISNKEMKLIAGKIYNYCKKENLTLEKEGGVK